MMNTTIVVCYNLQIAREQFRKKAAEGRGRAVSQNLTVTDGDERWMFVTVNCPIDRLMGLRGTVEMHSGHWTAEWRDLKTRMTSAL